MRVAMRVICASLAVAAFAVASPALTRAEDGAVIDTGDAVEAGADLEAAAADPESAGWRRPGGVTNLPVPRYVSLRSSEINVRRGPGLDYRKDWVFHRAGLPVRIIEEYGDWRRIVDKDDAGGWVYHAMLTGRRTVQVTADEAVLRTKPSETAAPVARAEQGVVARLEACQPNWCEVEADGHRGWVPKSAVWGVDPGEIVDD